MVDDLGYQSPYGAGHGTIPYQYIANENWESYAPVAVTADDQEPDEEVADETATKTRTLTIRVKGNVKLIIE